MFQGAVGEPEGRHVTPDELEAYRRDGVVLLRQALDPAWIRFGDAAMTRARGKPDSHFAAWKPADGDGETWFRFLPSRDNPDFLRFAIESPFARLAAEIMVSSTATLTGDLIVYKEPGTMLNTHWHQDSSGMPVTGSQHCVLWTAFEAVPRELAVDFARGSHKWGVTFMSRSQDPATVKDMVCVPIPDFEKDRASFDIIGWATEPGDVLAFHITTVHGARGGARIPSTRRILSTRWAGDDVRYTGKAVPSAFPTDDWAGLQPGDKIESPLKPRGWPRPVPLEASRPPSAASDAAPHPPSHPGDRP